MRESRKPDGAAENRSLAGKKSQEREKMVSRKRGGRKVTAG